MADYEKTGYLKEDFKYFHICTQKELDLPYHYHGFHKILFFLKGDVTYQVEGRSFDLLPHDIVLIPAGEIHRPVPKTNREYERIILYLSPSYLSACAPKANLSFCFEKAKKQASNVIRVPSLYQKRLSSLCAQLEEELVREKDPSSSFAGDLLQHTLVTELLILLNRASLNQHSIYLQDTCQNPQILHILEYINENLKEPLTIDMIADKFYLSRYHLMHLFKEATGYTVGNYLAMKRLLYARSLIQAGTPVIEACYQCGYQNYSTFSRAYKKYFHTSARSHLDTRVEYTP